MIFTIVFFSWVSFANASIVINEIQLKPTEERFIELYNSGSSPINLTNWYIQRKTASGSSFGSLVSKTYFEGESIIAGGYFLISRNLINYTDIIVGSLTLTESNTIRIKNASQEIVDDVEWGSVSEDKSIQRDSDGNWEEFFPTPGEPNEEVIVSNEEESNNQAVFSGTTTPIQQTSIIRKVKADIVIPKVIFVKTPFLISSLITTNRKETLVFGKYRWNLGDGTTREYSNLKEIEHTYFYPGEYVILLDYFEYGKLKPDASDRIIIKVIPSEISISSVGSSGDAFIELENKSNYEMVLSNWVIRAGIRQFVIPVNTTLLAKRKLKISPRITGFEMSDLEFILLTNPKGEVSTVYPEKRVEREKRIIKNNKVYNNLPLTKKVPPEEVLPIINLNELGASAGNIKNNYSWKIYSYWGLGVIIIIGITSALLLKRKDDSLDYMEEKIRAEDITIIE